MSRKSYKIVKKPWLEYACTIYGSKGALAHKLGVSPSCISNWLYTDLKIHPDICKKIEKLTHGKVSAEDLNPELKNMEIRIAKNISKKH